MGSVQLDCLAEVQTFIIVLHMSSLPRNSNKKRSKKRRRKYNKH
jgi:hypothetical protein